MLCVQSPDAYVGWEGTQEPPPQPFPPPPPPPHGERCIGVERRLIYRQHQHRRRREAQRSCELSTEPAADPRVCGHIPIRNVRYRQGKSQVVNHTSWRRRRLARSIAAPQTKTPQQVHHNSQFLVHINRRKARKKARKPASRYKKRGFRICV